MKVKHYLEPDIFKQVIDNTPLVSIDFVVVNNDRILVGKRKNRPAKDTFFVPGGRIHKGETFKRAFRRISREELGTELTPDQCEAMGIFDHMYPDSAVDENVSTHYVALAYKVKRRLMDMSPQNLKLQHEVVRMMKVKKVAGSADVHENTRVYARMLMKKE